MILSGQDIQKFNLLIDAKPENYQSQGCDIRVEKVFYPVDKPFGQKIIDEDYREFLPHWIITKAEAKEWSYSIPPNTSVLFKIMETVDLKTKEDTIGRFWKDADTGSMVNNIQHIQRYFNAYVLPKSSLTRRGVFVHSAWWDAGYKGSGFVLVRATDLPLIIKPGAEFAQMIFFEGTPTESVYNGQYQNENLKKEFP